jgi:hypothetical protein
MFDDEDEFGPSGIPRALRLKEVESLPLRDLRERFSALAAFARNIAPPGDLPTDFPHDFEASSRDELRAILWKYHNWFLSGRDRKGGASLNVRSVRSRDANERHPMVKIDSDSDPPHLLPSRLTARRPVAAS